MSHLFAYGTLICEDIMQAVSGQRKGFEAASLQHYERRSVIEQPYPALIERADATVTGVVYRDISDDMWQRLDLFEGERFERRLVTVQLLDGGETEACVYVLLPEHWHIVRDSGWDFERFMKEGRGTFESQYPGYKSID